MTQQQMEERLHQLQHGLDELVAEEERVTARRHRQEGAIMMLREMLAAAQAAAQAQPHVEEGQNA